MKKGDIVRSLINESIIVIVTGINNSSAKEQFRGVYLTGINKGCFFEYFNIDCFEVIDIVIDIIPLKANPIKWIFPKGSVVYVLDENGWHVGRMQNQVGPEITLSQLVPNQNHFGYKSTKELSFDLNKVFGITIENPFKGMPKEEQPKVYYNNCPECDEYLSQLGPGDLRQLKCWHQPWKK